MPNFSSSVICKSNGLALEGIYKIVIDENWNFEVENSLTPTRFAQFQNLFAFPYRHFDAQNGILKKLRKGIAWKKSMAKELWKWQQKRIFGGERWSDIQSWIGLSGRGVDFVLVYGSELCTAYIPAWRVCLLSLWLHWSSSSVSQLSSSLFKLSSTVFRSTQLLEPNLI